MKKLPETEFNFRELNSMFHGAIQSKLLLTAIELNVFDHLEHPTSSGQVAAALSCDPGNTALMLDALSACGLVEKKAGMFRNLGLAGDLLVKGKPIYLGDWIRISAESREKFMNGLTDLIRSGPGSASQGDHMNSAEACVRYTAAHAATSMAGIARRVAELVSALPEFADCRRMLDLGGGPGINAMAVVGANEHLSATVFDRPEIVRMAGEYIHTYGFGDRVDVIGGDYLADPLGSGYDLVMVTDSLYYDAQAVDSVLAKCCQAISPGGLLVAIHAVLTHERTRPAKMVLGMLPDALAGQASLPNKGFLADAMERCGFEDITSSVVDMVGSSMEMNVGHKPKME